MLRKALRSRWALLILVLLFTPLAFADSFSPGNPCFAEGTYYYSDSSHSTLVGANEFICWYGHRVWGQTTNYYRYQYYGPCCTYCTSWGVCGIEP